MKVLVADKFEQSGLDGLKALGAEVDYQPDLKDEALADALKTSGAELLVVRSTKVSSSMMDGGHLALIIRAGAGTNSIDITSASARGIFVANCPGKNSQAVAELAFGLMLACDRHIADNVAELRAGHWNKKRFSSARGLYGRTLGLVGMGKIGQEMATRAKAFGMQVIALSRWMSPEVAAAMGIGRATTPAELAKLSDFVSVHVALTPETRGMLGQLFFNAMKPGAVFVNTSRAEVVDQDAMERALAEGRITAGLDVFEGEPAFGEGVYDGSLRNFANVYCTHHIGASTEQAQEAVAAETVRIVKEYKATGVAPNVVNVAKAEGSTCLLVVRYVDHLGVLAGVLNVLTEEGVSVQEMENIMLGSSHGAIAQIALETEPSPNALLKMKLSDNVLDASVFPIQQ